MAALYRIDTTRMSLSHALREVAAERERQVTLKESGRFQYTPSDEQVTDSQRLAMLVEEVGEVARNCLARANLVKDGEASDKALRKELSQVAAIAVAWMEALGGWVPQ